MSTIARVEAVLKEVLAKHDNKNTQAMRDEVAKELAARALPQPCAHKNVHPVLIPCPLHGSVTRYVCTACKDFL